MPREPLPWPSFVTVWRAAFVLSALLIAAGMAVSIDLQPRSFIVLATTTSARDSGLLDYLIPYFQSDTAIGVRYTAVGTGQALDLGRRGDADVVLVHAPSAELAFMAAGQGLCRSPVMMNQFVVVGPNQSDPAGILGLTNATIAFERIRTTHSLFISRGDNSGTNIIEKTIWSWVGYMPSTTNDTWYKESGQGMAATLDIASQLVAYTLSDDGTFLVHSANLELRIDVQHDPALRNFYSVIPVNPSVHPNIFVAGALRFAKWLTSARGQSLIGNYTAGGVRPFQPDGQDLCP
jgi:tungstate transport system substrate-binding protein